MCEETNVESKRIELRNDLGSKRFQVKKYHIKNLGSKNAESKKLSVKKLLDRNWQIFKTLSIMSTSLRPLLLLTQQ